MKNQHQSVPMDVENTTNTASTTNLLVQAGVFALPSPNQIAQGLAEMHEWLQHTGWQPRNNADTRNPDGTLRDQDGDVVMEDASASEPVAPAPVVWLG